MASRSRGPGRDPAVIAFCALLVGVAIACLAAATADAAQYKMLLCAGNNGSNSFGTSTNTISGNNPGGIFSFENYCGPAPDPAGNAAHLRIVENQAGGNAGNGAYGFMYWDTPPFVHYKTAGGWTRQPNAFNDGWRSRFWGIDFGGNGFQIFSQGVGGPAGIHNTFAPHLWPGGNADFWRFAFELNCVRSAGCDRANFNATDLNTIMFTLNDDQDAQVAMTNGSPLMGGGWVRGMQTATWNVADNGSGLRFERLRIDGHQRHQLDHRAGCNLGASGASGEFARVFQPCPTGGPYGHSYTFDTATLSDGQHTVQVCAQDYGQAVGLNGTGSESCAQRAVFTDNTAPGAPGGLHIVSSNPARYLSQFNAIFSLPPSSGSPITKVRYSVTDAAGKVLVPEKVVSGTNPTELAKIDGPKAAGDYRLRVQLEDAVGLVGPAATVPVPRDTTPPAAPQEVAVTAPDTPRAAQGFDVRWRNIVDAGSPIDAVHYRVVSANGATEIVPPKTLPGDNPEKIESLDTPRERGSAALLLWLSDAEGNVGAPVKVPLAYDCVRADAAGGLTLSAGLGKSDASSIVVPQKEGATISGKLLGLGGQIANAPLCVFSKVVTDQDRQFLGLAMTGADGSYQFAIGAGPSRELAVVYRADQRELTARATIKTRVHPTFKLRGKVVKNKGKPARFSGCLPGPNNEKVIVVLQVKSGKGWRVFRRYRTRKGGCYVMRYRFTQTYTPTTFIMRAQVRAQSGYPYEEGNSRSIPVPVTP